MSKQADAKAQQGYIDKAMPSTCSNCVNFSSEKKLPAWKIGSKSYDGRPYSVIEDGVEKNMRCSIGGFSVKKTATCNHFEPKKS